MSDINNEITLEELGAMMSDQGRGPAPITKEKEKERKFQIEIHSFQDLAGVVPPSWGVDRMRIERLELSTRTFNCLKRARVDWVAEALALSDVELLAIRGFTQPSLDELRRKLDLVF